jgi:hypothetical protein
MIPAVRWICEVCEVSSLRPKERCFDDETLIGQSTQMLASFLATGGANGGFNPLYQIRRPPLHPDIALAITRNQA